MVGLQLDKIVDANGVEFSLLEKLVGLQRNIPAEPPAPVKPAKPGAKPPPDFEPITAEHKIVDVNIVLTVIYDYIKQLKKDFLQTGREGISKKIEAGEQLLALILKAVENA